MPWKCPSCNSVNGDPVTQCGCGKAWKCPSCGKIATSPITECDCGYNKKDLRIDLFEGYEDFSAFLGEGDEYYYSKFSTFVNKGHRFSFTWNWAAFFFQDFWLLYRKLYLWFLISVFLNEVIPLLIYPDLFYPMRFISGIVWGMIGNYLYFRKAIKVINKADELKLVKEDRNKFISKRGGCHVWVAIIAALLWVTQMAFLCYSARNW